MDGTAIVAIISALVGGSGISAVLTTIFSARKYKAEAQRLEEETRSSRDEAYRKNLDYIQQKMIELSSKYESEADALRKRNDELDAKIAKLNDRIQQLMQWIVVDNNRYRVWLETELKRADPSITFPECPCVPDCDFHDDIVDSSND